MQATADKPALLRLRGEYIDFSLPHQDAGGKRDYISRDGRQRFSINID